MMIVIALVYIVGFLLTYGIYQALLIEERIQNPNVEWVSIGCAALWPLLWTFTGVVCLYHKLIGRDL